MAVSVLFETQGVAARVSILLQGPAADGQAGRQAGSQASKLASKQANKYDASNVLRALAAGCPWGFSGSLLWNGPG